MPVLEFNNLLCGYTIRAVDEAKRVSHPYGQMSIPLRITHSPIPFFATLHHKPSAFRDALKPINVKGENARKEAIEEELIRWVQENYDNVETMYRRNVDKVCDGDCSAKICFGKAAPKEA